MLQKCLFLEHPEFVKAILILAKYLPGVSKISLIVVVTT